MKKSIRNNFVLIFMLAFCLSISVDARSSKRKKLKRKRTNIKKSINEAMKRSDKDQDKIRDRMNDEADKRIDSWSHRGDNTIEIKYTGTTSIEPVGMGGADLMPDSGEDHSGLNELHSPVEDEPTDINFDEELRDVSSMKD